MAMIKHSLIILSAMILCGISFVSCSNDDDDDYLGNWVEMGDVGKVPRTEAVCFTIENTAYVGTGYYLDEEIRLKDFWSYSAESGYWKQIASLPGVARNGAVAFSSSTKGYVGTGYDGENKLKDFYEYDPSNNTWTQKNDFAGEGRYGATAFYVNGKGFIGTGYGDVEVDSDETIPNNLSDFWSYDIATDSWEQVSSFNGSKRRNAMSFVLNDVAYVLSGYDNEYLDDMYKYDAVNDQWTELAHISDYEDDSYDDDYTIARYSAVTFVAGGKGYVTTGIQGGNSIETWEYEPSTDRWEQKTDFEGTSRYGAVAFTINDIGYVATGGNGNYSLDDVWQFNPFEEYESKD
ncbi:Kelch repeat-containing protein [Saccharicrinis fermentans]|uniref:N-acetylneuraminic acid mutarotase n=1 Tax=Saccharicrinis fermentans DSM 9555 = JCM 21142 TaxID=869213 RepID=W7YIG3_9BACT|nr:kelch repeat-containing protein [Saccharicrinis fermentans]GAF04266.1 N-acetylneuraminic acid mutarotase [Saccharicrinis fermentans DSM 9555 = JCM 21142]